MARTSDDAGGWPSDRKPKEPDWLEEHGAEFYFDQRGIRHFRSRDDSERWFHADHGDCGLCEGTGFETFKRGAIGYARRCEYLPPLKGRAPSTERRGGFTKANP